MSYSEFATLQDFWVRFETLLAKESERGAAVLVIIFIDGYIDRVLAEYANQPETLQAIPASLEESPRRIKTLYLKQLATSQQAEHLQLLRDVRNAFAHELEAHSFPAIAGLLGTSPELAGDAFRSLLQESSRLLGGLLYSRFEERRHALHAYSGIRMQAYRQIAEIDRQIYRASLTNREANRLTYTTEYGAQFVVGVEGDRLARIFAFTLDGREWVAVNDPGSGDDHELSAWVAALPIDQWGTVGTGYT